MSGLRYPQRIVCLTAETTEIAYALGAGNRVAGVCGFSTRPAEARLKPKVGGFTSVNIPKVLDLKPDLVLAYSDLQAEAVAELVRQGIPVLACYQKSIPEILQTILMIGGVIGCPAQAEALAGELQSRIDRVKAEARALPVHPRIFFEEWPDPLIAGIRWVSELIELAGGQDIFADIHPKNVTGRSKDRIVEPAQVVRRDPEIIIGSWCGRKVNFSKIYERPGWEQVSAIRHRQIHEVKSVYVLQPGPAIVEGLEAIAAIVRNYAAGQQAATDRRATEPG